MLACALCKGDQSSREVITNPPEILFVHMERLGFTKEGPGKKTEYPIKLQDFTLDKKYNSLKVDVEYELTSVILHHAMFEFDLGGHYTILVKGKDGGWTHLDDASKPVSMTGEQMAETMSFCGDAYGFTFRRKPLDETDFLNNTTAIVQATPVEKPQPFSGSAEGEKMMEYIGKLFEYQRAQLSKDWDDGAAKRKLEWDTWADSRDAKRQKNDADELEKLLQEYEDAEGGEKGAEGGDDGANADADADAVAAPKKASIIQGLKHHGLLRVTLTTPNGSRPLDLTMKGLGQNKVLQVPPRRGADRVAKTKAIDNATKASRARKGRKGKKGKKGTKVAGGDGGGAGVGAGGGADGGGGGADGGADGGAGGGGGAGAGAGAGADGGGGGGGDGGGGAGGDGAGA